MDFVKTFWKNFLFHLELLPFWFIGISLIVAILSWISHIQPIEMLKTFGIGFACAYLISALIFSIIKALKN